MLWSNASSQWKMLVLNVLMHWHMSTSFWKKPCDAETWRSLMMLEPVAAPEKMHHLLSSITLDLHNSQHASSWFGLIQNNFLNFSILYNSQQAPPFNESYHGIHHHHWPPLKRSFFLFQASFTSKSKKWGLCLNAWPQPISIVGYPMKREYSPWN